MSIIIIIIIIIIIFPALICEGRFFSFIARLEKQDVRVCGLFACIENPSL